LAANYTLTSATATTTASITPVSVTASVTASNKTYSGTTAATITGCTLSGVLATDSSNVTCAAGGGSFASKNVGSGITVTATGIALSGSAAANYTLTSATATTTANITTALLTVTASSGSLVYGGAVPAITASYSGFVGSDSASSLTTAPTCSTTATSTSPVNSYPSSCKGAVDSNYAISYTAGSISVTPAMLTITAGTTSTSYGTVPAVVPSYSGFAAGNTPASLSPAPVCASTVTAATAVGAYTGANTCVGAADPNYHFTYVAGTATVTQAAQTITFTQPSTPVLYGVAPIPLSGSASSNLGVAFSLLSGPGMISGNLLTVTGVGSIAVQASQSGNTNYTAAPPVTRTIVVTPATLTITANGASRVYGTANPIFTGTVSGQRDSDTFVEKFKTRAMKSSDVGSYTITPTVTGADLTDYRQVVTNGTLSITPAATTTTLTASNNAITPGQSVTLKATVKSTTTGIPPGSVNFLDGGTLLSNVTLLSGTATYSTAALAPGVAHTLTATYLPGSNKDFASGSSTASIGSTVTVAPLDFTMTLTGPSNLTVVPGNSVSFQVKVTPDYGSYAGPVNFAMTGLPPGATATFSPSSIAANSGPQTVVVTITAAPKFAMLHREAPPDSQGRKTVPFALAFLLLFGVGGLRKRGKMLLRWACVLLLAGASLAAIAGLSGCGSATGFFGQAQQNYTVTLTATSATLQHSETFTLNVQ
ncbi:MAG: MBG domain-containing protein, partial [Acidobacteriota bacterium]